MSFSSKFMGKYSRYSIVLLMQAGYSLLNPVSALANPEDSVTRSPNLSQASIGSSKVTAANFPVLPATVNLIKQHEGFRPYAYIDSSGLPVIGYGQTRVNGQTVSMGQYITQADADAALEQELYHIQSLVLNSVRVDLNPHQLGALTSLVYNAGTRVVTQSTLSRKLNAGDFAGAASEFPRWNKANQGGQLVEFPGLTKRRLDEQKLFLTPSY